MYKILVKKVDRLTSSEQLSELLSGNQKKLTIEIVTDKITGENTGQAIIKFESKQAMNTFLKGGIYVLAGEQLEFEILKSL